MQANPYTRAERVGAYLTGVGLGMLLAAAMIREDQSELAGRLLRGIAGARAELAHRAAARAAAGPPIDGGADAELARARAAAGELEPGDKPDTEPAREICGADLGAGLCALPPDHEPPCSVIYLPERCGAELLGGRCSLDAGHRPPCIVRNGWGAE